MTTIKYTTRFLLVNQWTYKRGTHDATVIAARKTWPSCRCKFTRMILSGKGHQVVSDLSILLANSPVSLTLEHCEDRTPKSMTRQRLGSRGLIRKGRNARASTPQTLALEQTTPRRHLDHLKRISSILNRCIVNDQLPSL
jgi:predicted metal-dependent HD superfamily phosphohydrolase